MDKAGITIEMNQKYLQKLEQFMDDLSNNSYDGMKLIIAETAVNIHRDTTSPSSFPVVTGALRASYSIDVQDMEGSVYSELDYADNVESGIGQPAQPHLVPAYEKNISRFYRAVDKLIEQNI